MTEEEFIAKYKTPDIEGVWCIDAASVFWARSYGMKEHLLYAMSKDFFSIKGITHSYSSSHSLAIRTISEYQK